jgi:hypothetical protein
MPLGNTVIEIQAMISIIFVLNLFFLHVCEIAQSLLKYGNSVDWVYEFSNDTITSPILIHIPKSGGTSAKSLFRKAGYADYQKLRYCEKCFRNLYDANRFTLTFFRSPRSHVYSQYLECRYTPFGKFETQHYSDFPRDGTNVEGFIKWIDFFDSKRNTIIKNGKREAFGCYNPNNMQIRVFTENCLDTHYYYSTLQTHEQMIEAKENINKLSFFGITDLFDASTCLMWYYLRREDYMKAYCTRNSTIKNVHEDHNAPKHSIFDVPESTWIKVDELTRYDIATYRYALRIFLRNVLIFQNETGIDISHLIHIEMETVMSLSIPTDIMI